MRVVTARRPDASLAAAGMLAPGIEAAEAALTGKAHPRLGALLLDAAGLWPAFATELYGDPSDWRAIGFRQVDTLLAGEAKDSSHLDALAKAGADMGAKVEALSGDAARQIEPALAPSATHALHFPGDALVEPPLLLAALESALRKGGVEIDIARITGLAQSKAIVRLETDGGHTFEADAAVLASGWPGAAKLAPELAHILPIKGQIGTLSVRAGLRTMLRGPGIYLAPRGDGRVACGATSERGVETLTIEPMAIQTLRDLAIKLAPAFNNAWTIASRTGIRPSTPDFAPILGPSALGSRVFLAAGPHRNGMLLAPLVADIVADGITSAPESGEWLRVLSAARFRG